MRLLFVVPPGHAGVKLGGFLRGQGVAMGLLRSVKYQPGGLQVNGAWAKTNQQLCAGDVVQLTLPLESGYSATPQGMPLEVVYESPHALVLNKPAGLVVHPTRSHKTGTLANGVCHMMQQRGRQGFTFRPIGRLDGNTSGPVLCAMNEFAAPALAACLAKSYLALAGGRLLQDGEINAPLGPAGDSVVRQCVRPDGKPSLTRYAVLAAAETASLVRVWPQTGRTHQIRAHFAHIGHPLLGDGLYGGDETLIKRHALHCEALSFCEPFVIVQTHAKPLQTGGSRRVECSLPSDMQAVLKATGLDKASTKLYNATNKVWLE